MATLTNRVSGIPASRSMLNLLQPRLSTSIIRQSSRFISTTSTTTSSSTTSSSASKASVRSLRQTTPVPPIPTFTQIQAQSLFTRTYHVVRTASAQLPVYHIAGRGGNLKQTRVRRVHGDRAALRAELIAALGLDAADVVLNPTTGHVVVKGWRKNEVIKFLEEQGM